MNKPDPRLVEIFEYNFGIDLTEQKYQSGLYELAQFFSDTIQKSFNEYMNTPQIVYEATDEVSKPNTVGTPDLSKATPVAVELVKDNKK